MYAAVNCLVAWASLNALVFMLSWPSVNDTMGGITLEGCKTCDDADPLVIYRCNVVTVGGETGCTTAGCMVIKWYWAACEEDATDEVNDCEMHVDPNAKRKEWYELVKEGNLTCEENFEDTDLPDNGDCQSPGNEDEDPLTSRCLLDDACGTMVKAGSEGSDKPRLVCGPAS